MRSSIPPRHVPRLRFRPTTRADLPECLSLPSPWLGLDAPARRALPQLWERMVDEPAAPSTVMEDLAMPAGERIQGWGIGIVLPESWVHQKRLNTNPSAYVGRALYEALLDGSLALMNDAEIGTANASGRFYLLNFYTQRQEDVENPYAHSVLHIANDSFRIAASGFNAAAMYLETNAREAPALAAAGFRRRSYANERALESLPPQECPVLLGLTREEARGSLPGTTVRQVFEHHPPMFRFSSSQRRLLWLALFDESDAHLTEQLGVSAHGLKKLWRGIYERIEHRMPEFFGDASGADEGKRGPEKRRQVLAYVRQRPEELRPWLAASQTSRSSAGESADEDP